jgi:outer membrane protein TolC
MRWVLTTAFALLISVPAFAQEVQLQTLTWPQAFEEARKNHPDLVSAREKINQNKAQKNITRSGALPQIDASAGASTAASTGKRESESYDYGVSARQLLFDGFKNSNDTAAAREQIRAAVYNYEVVSSNVRLRLWTAFVDLLAAQENFKVVEAIAERRKQSFDLVTLRYENGREHRGSLLTAQANLSQARFEVEQAQRAIYFSQRRLSKELGRANFVPIEAQGALDVLAIDGAMPDFEGLVSTVPFLKELAAQKEAARFGVKSAQSNFFPQVYATGGAGRSDTSWPPSSRNWSAGLSVSVPLFEGGLQQAQLARARAAYNQSQADERSGRDGMILTLAQSKNNSLMPPMSVHKLPKLNIPPDLLILMTGSSLKMSLSKIKRLLCRLRPMP